MDIRPFERPAVAHGRTEDVAFDADGAEGSLGRGLLTPAAVADLVGDKLLGEAAVAGGVRYRNIQVFFRCSLF